MFPLRGSKMGTMNHNEKSIYNEKRKPGTRMKEGGTLKENHQKWSPVLQSRLNCEVELRLWTKPSGTRWISSSSLFNPALLPILFSNIRNLLKVTGLDTKERILSQSLPGVWKHPMEEVAMSGAELQNDKEYLWWLARKVLPSDGFSQEITKTHTLLWGEQLEIIWQHVGNLKCSWKYQEKRTSLRKYGGFSTRPRARIPNKTTWSV